MQVEHQRLPGIAGDTRNQLAVRGRLYGFGAAVELLVRIEAVVPQRVVADHLLECLRARLVEHTAGLLRVPQRVLRLGRPVGRRVDASEHEVKAVARQHLLEHLGERRISIRHVRRRLV